MNHKSVDVNEIYRVPLPKAKLEAIPRDERNLLLFAGHAVNQITVLRRVLIFSLNYEARTDLENTLNAAQSQTLLRISFAALAETWEMIKRSLHQRLIGRDYANEIEQGGRDAYDALNGHFGSSNLLHLLRNKIVFHYPESSELDAAFAEVPDDEDWAWYPADTINNSFYLASDFVISAGILRLTGESDPGEAFKKVMGIFIPVSDDMLTFLLYLMRAIVNRHLGNEFLSLAVGGGTKIGDAPDLYSVSIPFFTTRDH